MKFRLLTVALILVFGSLAFGQTLRGRIEGTVKDTQGQLVPNASITATNIGTGEKLNATSTNEGVFSINEVKPGSYTINAEVQGFKKVLIEGISVQVGTVTSVTVQLEIGTVNEEVTVSADDAQMTINTSNAEVGEVVDRQKILELPLDGRNPFELTALQAGVQTILKTVINCAFEKKSQRPQRPLREHIVLTQRRKVRREKITEITIYDRAKYKSSADGEVSSFSINGNRTVANNLSVPAFPISGDFRKPRTNES